MKTGNILIGAVSFSTKLIYSKYDQLYLKPVKDGKKYLTTKVVKKTNNTPPGIKVGDTVKVRYSDLGMTYYVIDK
jgi:hypothetical protein